MKRTRHWLRSTALLMSSLAHAQQVEPQLTDFTWQLPLTVSGDNGVVQLPLPLRVYQESRSSALADVRIFNAAGQALPFALVPDTGSDRVVWRDSAAQLFPLYGAAGRSGQTRLDFGLTADGRLAWVRPQQVIAEQQALTGLVLDLGTAQVDDILDSLQLIRSSNESYRAEVAIDGSNDLKQWERVARSRVDWLRSSQADQSLVNDRIALGIDGSRYLRLQWLEGTPELFDRVMLHWRRTEHVQPPLFDVKLDPAPGKSAGDLLYSASPAIAATQVELDIANANSVLPASIGFYTSLASAAHAAPRFESLAHGSFYRLTQNGQEHTSDALNIAPQSRSEWVVRPDSPTELQPKLVLRWHPSRIVFTARSNTPQDRRRFILALGAAPAKVDGWVIQQTSWDRVAPGFNFKELLAAEQAVPGEWQSVGVTHVVGTPKTPDDAQPSEKRRLLLWSVLLLGALVLAGMTWRLYRQMQAPPSSPGA